jgi:hypothetical protein
VVNYCFKKGYSNSLNLHYLILWKTHHDEVGLYHHCKQKNG